MTNILLPDKKEVTIPEATEIVARYLRENGAAVALYDDTNVGPHDELLAVDLLSLNALNAFAGAAPMTIMDAMWKARDRIPAAVSPISRAPYEEIADPRAEIPRLASALHVIEVVDGFGGAGTRTAKLMHRLRPNISPIWDTLVGEWYGGPTKPWVEFLSAAFTDISLNRAALLRVREAAAPRLTIVRIWDILLWKLRR